MPESYQISVSKLEKDASENCRSNFAGQTDTYIRFEYTAKSREGEKTCLQELWKRLEES